MQSAVRVRRLFGYTAKEHPSLRRRRVELVEGKSSDGVVMGLGASVGNGKKKGEVKSASSKVPRNLTSKKAQTKTIHVSLSLVGTSATHEKICVWVTCASWEVSVLFKIKKTCPWYVF